MKKKLYLIFLVLLSQLDISAQSFNNIWNLGYTLPDTVNSGWGTFKLKFIADTFTIDTANQIKNMKSLGLNTSICNERGIYQFGCNGKHIINKNGAIMQNGNNLAPCFYSNHADQRGTELSQGAVIIPYPSDTNKYYVFYETYDIIDDTNSATFSQPGHLFYALVDMTFNNGLGKVIEKDKILISDTLIEGQLTACKHANGRDWWLMVGRYKSTKYYSVLATPDTLLVGEQVMTGVPARGFLSWKGQACFSPDGNWYAHYDPHNFNELHYYNFDRCSGLLSNSHHINLDTLYYWASGLAFSPNSRFMYVMAGHKAFQLDMSVTPEPIPLLLDTFDGFYSFYSVLKTDFYRTQLAPNGRIYVSSGSGTRHYGVVYEPDSLGLACKFKQHDLLLPVWQRNVPNLPNYQLGSLSGSPCDTISSTQFLQKEKSKSLSANPNPANESFYLNYNNKENTSLQIVDAFGKIIYSQVLYSWFTSQYIDCSNWPNGVYVAQVKSQSSGELKGSCKVVVLR